MTPDAARLRFDILGSDIVGGNFNVVAAVRSASSLRILHEVN
jgi:hypothetical protein